MSIGISTPWSVSTASATRYGGEFEAGGERPDLRGDDLLHAPVPVVGDIAGGELVAARLRLLDDACVRPVVACFHAVDEGRQCHVGHVGLAFRFSATGADTGESPDS